MSIKENDIFLEAAQEHFREVKEGKTKAKIILELRENGFKKESDDLIEDWYSERMAWLNEHNLEFGDVIQGEEGEYYIDEIENGTPGEEGYGFSTHKIAIPDYLNIDLWLKQT